MEPSEVTGEKNERVREVEEKQEGRV